MYLRCCVLSVYSHMRVFSVFSLSRLCLVLPSSCIFTSPSSGVLLRVFSFISSGTRTCVLRPLLCFFVCGSPVVWPPTNRTGSDSTVLSSESVTGGVYHRLTYWRVPKGVIIWGTLLGLGFDFCSGGPRVAASSWALDSGSSRSILRYSYGRRVLWVRFLRD